MGLPGTTELAQLLDQVFANLQASYSNEKDQVFDDQKVNHERFIQILASIWDVWTRLQKSQLKKQQDKLESLLLISI